MKTYPKILGGMRSVKNASCIAFKKYDGSNLRFEYNKKRGWYKFGTRTRLFDENDFEYGAAIPLFKEKYAHQISQILLNHSLYRKFDSFVVYAEYFGPYSFAGRHDPEYLNVKENPLDLIVFDVNINKKGIIGPEEFVNLFGELQIAEIIYRGKFTQQFFDDVRSGKYPVDEGVIVKGGEGHKLWMRKVKTFQYLKRLQEAYGEKWKDFWE